MRNSKTLKIYTLPPLRPGSLNYDRLYAFDDRQSQTIRPFTKQAGGKRRLIREFITILPTEITGYVDGTVGGAPIFFALQSLGWLDSTQVVLNDIDPELMNAYRDVRDHLKELIENLKYYERLYKNKGSNAYYRIVKEWNEGNRDTARFIFLRALAYNGLFRYNQSGELNSPCASYEHLNFDLRNMERASKALKGVELANFHFKDMATSEALIRDKKHIKYFDPPYDQTFTNYTPEGFNDDDQTRLIEVCAELARAGHRVIYSQANTDKVKKWISDIWPTAAIFKVYPFSSIAASGDARRNRNELLVIDGFEPAF
jgi:DNA adenine methylase